MDFLRKSGSAKENIQFPPDLFNGARHLQCECERNLLSSDDDEHILCRNDNNFLGSGDHTYSNDAINIVTIIKMTVFVNVKALVVVNAFRLIILKL